MGAVEQEIVEHFRRMAGEGTELELIGRAGGRVQVRYRRRDDACETCVLSSEDLGELMMEVFARRDPTVTGVEVIS